MSSQWDGKLAEPGDDDLDCDVSGVTITAVVRDGPEILVRMTGGLGAWASEDTDELTDIVHVDEVSMHCVYLDMSEGAMGQLLATLEGWRDNAVPIRVCCAPERMTTLIADRDHWLPFPRLWPPPRFGVGEYPKQ